MSANRHLRERAVAAADRWVLLHCAPDQISLTHGAMLNLANVIEEALHKTACETAWRSIETAPRDGTPVDLWIVGDPAEVEFYCALSRRHRDRVHHEGRVTNVAWRDGDWRPICGLHRLHGLGSLPISILWWMPTPEPPQNV